MKFENTNVYNFENAFRGMRNPLESWNRSDSQFGHTILQGFIADEKVALTYIENKEKSLSGENSTNFKRGKYGTEILKWLWKNGVKQHENNVLEYNLIGAKDMTLAQKLIQGGSEHRKFLRQIFVTVDITAPMYWWSEFDTYKIGTTANSTSKMHKIASRPITLDCFEIGDYDNQLLIKQDTNDTNSSEIEFFTSTIIDNLELLRQRYLETKDKRYWKELIRWLPTSWLQTRTVTMNYENLRTIYHQRKNHKLTEWSNHFCNWVETLPYATSFLIN